MPYHVLEKHVQLDSGIPVLLSFNADNSFVSRLCIMMLRRRRKIPKRAVVSSETSLLGMVRSTLPSFNDFETEAACPHKGMQTAPCTMPKPMHQGSHDFRGLSIRSYCLTPAQGKCTRLFSADTLTNLDMNPPFYLASDSCLNLWRESLEVLLFISSVYLAV